MENRLKELYNIIDVKSDKGTSHAYIDGYYSNEFKGKEHNNIRLLEIGIKEGHSHYLWNKFFINGEIYGVDNGESGFTCEVLKNTQVKLYKEDAYTKIFADKFDNEFFDYIIEDGSHRIEDWLKSIDLFLPKLKSGGKLIIEDIGDMECANKVDKKGKEHILSQKSQIIDLRNLNNRWDDIIVEIIKK